MSGVFKYAEGTEPKPNTASDSTDDEEVAEERKDSNAPAPAEVGTNTYQEGDRSSGPVGNSGGSFSNSSGTLS